MVRKSIYSFDFTTSTGIDLVPLNGIFLIEDSDGNNNSKLLVLKDKTNFDGNTTIAQVLLTDQVEEIGNTATQTITNIPATADQTDFTVNYDVNSIEVFVNGIKVNNADYDASTGTNVVFYSPQDEGTWVQFITSLDIFVSGVDWANIANTPTTLTAYGITDAYTQTQTDALNWSWNDITSDVPTTLSGYGITDAAGINDSNTFTAPQRTSITTEDNNIDFTSNNNFTVPAAATTIQAFSTVGCTGQSGVITFTTAENITGWDTIFKFKTVPTGLTGEETFGYFIESETIIRIGRMS